jgi:hypothetical protein
MALIGGDAEVNKKTPKLLSFKFKVQSGFHNSFTFTIINKDFDDPNKQIDFCTIVISSAGNNLPCIHAYDEAYTRQELHNDTIGESPSLNVVEE